MSTQTRMTRQRAVILETLRSVHTHPTADEVYAMVKERIPRISLGTVYRNLDLLATDKQILKLESGGSTRRYDGTITPHYHIRCSCCGRVADVDGQNISAPDIDRLHVEGFAIHHARVEFEGICQLCLEEHPKQ